MSIFRGLIASLVTLLAISPVTVDASIFGNALTAGLNRVQDQNREWLIKADGNDQEGVIEDGDILESVLFFDTLANLNGTKSINSIPGLAGLTAWSRVVVTITVDNGNESEFSFAPALPNGTAISVYEGSSLNDPTDFETGDTSTLVAAATSGAHLFDLTLDGIDDYWEATGPIDLSNLFFFPVDFEFGLSVVNNTALVPIVKDAFTPNGLIFWDIIGEGDVSALTPGPSAEGVQAESNTRISLIAAPVPEPASLFTWGGILVAACGLGLKKRFTRE